MASSNVGEGPNDKWEGPNDKCLICGKADETKKLTKVYDKGKSTLLQYSVIRGDKDFNVRLQNSGTFYIHENCRRSYIDKRNITEASEQSSKKLRSSLPDFDWNSNCLFCGEEANQDDRHPDRNPVWMVRTMEIKTSILSKCNDRIDRPWSEDVKTRLLSCSDLVSPNARYHRRCYVKFFKTDSGPNIQPGRPSDRQLEQTFNELCQWLEDDNELHSLSEIHSQMERLSGDGQSYSEKRLRQKLQEKYGDHVFFAQMGGSRKDVVCFVDMASLIINEKWYQDRKSDKNLEAQRIMSTAAKLIQEEIKARDYSKTEYPHPNDYKNINSCQEFLTPCLRTLLTALLGENLKSASIGHAITQLVRPKSVLSPLLFFLCVEMDHVFGSRWLNDELYSLGFSISHDELVLLRHSIMQQVDDLSILSSPEKKPVQFVGDNADSRIQTLDGSGTFHGLGMIKFAKKKYATREDTVRIQRRSRISVSQFKDMKTIPVLSYVPIGPPALTKHKFIPLAHLKLPCLVPPRSYYSNLIWSSSEFFRRSMTPSRDWLNWSGFMTHVFKGHDNIDEDQVTILPLLDLDPNDESTLYSCLMFVSQEVRKLKLKETSVTFDQPLYLKSQEIAMSKGITNVVVRLGPFHTMMSAVGSIFDVMKGSGIEDALLCIYGATTIVHVMSGKAIAKALRFLNLLNAALTFKLIQTIPESKYDKIHLEHVLEDIYKRSEVSTDYLDKIQDSSYVNEFDSQLRCTRQELSLKSRTAKLWLQFQEHADKINTFIACERLKSWEGHLNATTSLLNLFAATGHLHYTRSARLYVQEMRRLPVTHPDLYNLYMNSGMHAVQRTDHPFNGLSTDLVIEQALMKVLKSRGGLTHGRGMTESVRLQWVYTMPFFVSVHNAMTELTGKVRSDSDEHKEYTAARRKRDTDDLNKLIVWLDENNPYDDDVTVLKSLSSGLISKPGDGVNCDEADRIGKEIHEKLDNKVFREKIKKAWTVKTLWHLAPGVKIGGKEYHINPEVLVLRCVSVAQRLSEDVEPYFAYELSAMPSSLFDGYFMRHSNKSDLSNMILKNIRSDPTIPTTTNYVTLIDGGWLLNYVRWTKRAATYQSVIEQYVNFVEKFPGSVVIFDGYESCTKDHEHQRRMIKSKSLANTISIKLDAPAYRDQSAFLANVENKKSLIDEISRSLELKNIKVVKCTADADTRVVHEALDYAANDQSVIVVANDTDILIMLLYHWKPGMDIKIRMYSTKTVEMYSIKTICDNLAESTRKNLLFTHAFTGCDTTSGIFGLGKNVIYKSLDSNDKLKQLGGIISESDSSGEEIAKAGCEVFCILYGDKNNTRLTKLRHMKFNQMMCDKNTIDAARLPPTEHAAKYHTLRVHQQIIVWEKLNETILDPLLWGWKMVDGQFRPVPTDLPPAPDNVLNFIRCKCKSTQNLCGTNHCTCKKNGMKCVAACGGCHGESCKNAEQIDLEE
ncbi:hypothetical protein SNE40_003750 [Patella caerulea]|uniref:Tesmin/TSO1-like CXC domain-containing protein n=1 Tax=Patella caerulea TaxID=87958 RepID=A0AAN8K3L7_PATCE